ncbi:MAG: XRE family transcriptional regulator [Caulobacteraceae bacterium]|nr:MAG: XRE family transcriptional regulator [Caulobacteraceae bacterium]
MDVRWRLGKRVQLLRQRAGVSQEELAERAGIHRTYVSGVERGVRNPTITVLEKLAKGLGVELGELVSFEG